MIRTRCVQTEDTSLNKLLLWAREKEKKFGREIRGREEKLLSAGIRLVGGEPCKKKKSRYLKEDPGERDPSLPRQPFFPSGRKLARALTLLSTTSKRYSLTHSLSSYRLSSSPLTPFFQNCPRLLSSKYSKFFSIRRGRRFLEQSATEKEDRESILFIFRFRRVSLQREREKEREEIVSVKKIFMYISEVFDYIEILRDFDYVSCSSNCIFLKKRLLVLKK